MMNKRKNKFIKVLMLLFVSIFFLNEIFVVQATNIQDVKDQLEDDKDTLKDINGQISDLEDEQDILEEEITDLDAELLNTMTSIGLIEDEIKEKELAFEKVQKEYEEVLKQVEDQYAAMKVRIQYMYENGNQSYLEILLEAGSLSEFLNKAEYVNSIYEYDRILLEQYEESKSKAEELRDRLMEEKKELDLQKGQLEEQKETLDVLIEEKKKTSSNFEAQIAKARQEAAVYKTKIRQEEAELKRLEEEERRQNAADNIGNITVTKFDTSIIDKAPGSELGKTIAKYGCQYIGNPYVLGGTSLTNGTDCSGFTYRIYYNFGYKIPRTSTQQRSAGTAVASLDEAQPGDIICYSGHVGLYVGGGYIVHASSKKTGIKISKATYRQILAIRRIIS